MHGALSAYLRDSAGFYADPLHGHSFSGVSLHALATVDRSLLFFRDCLLCDERLLAIGKPPGSSRRRKPSDTPSPGPRPPGSGVCQCLGCGKFAHRACLSFAHRHRNCRGHDALLPLCSHAPPPAALLLPSTTEQQAANDSDDEANTRRTARPEGFTLATLIEELSNSGSGVANASESSPTGSKPKQQIRSASKLAKRLAPVLAAGGVVGAIALGPAAGVLAGLNVLLASVGAETMLAGLGLTAGAAAAATVTRRNKARAAKRSRDRMKKGEWAMEICWACKKSFEGAPSDETCRKDAEFLRRFQISRQVEQQAEKKNDAAIDTNGLSTRRETYPDDAEVYRFLFGIFASPSEFLGQMNMQLCEAFRQRYSARHEKKAKRPRANDKASTTETAAARALAKDTLQDAKMYVAHVLGATMQCFPSLASTPEAVASCTLAVERVVYDDIHAAVFGEFQRAFREADAAFADNLADIRREQKHRAWALLVLPQQQDTRGRSPGDPVLAAELQKAEKKLVAMMQSTSSPLQKLVLLCDAFRCMCCFAEQLHQSASNADMLIPILCALLVECPRVCGSQAAFVAEIAYISFFTSGGGKGVEGYVLTTFQAAIQVLAAVDLPSGHAKELELFTSDSDDGAGEETEDDDAEDDEFFDAVSTQS